MNPTFRSFLLASLGASTALRAAVVVGDIALIGRQNNASPDAFAFVALNPISAGETLYFTDNGWTGTQYRGASATAGSGFEDLTRWTANTTISAGTIIRSTDSSVAYSWATSGAVPGTTSGAFSNLTLPQSGDQIYAFTAASSNPLFTPTAHLFVLDDTGTFENAVTGGTGGQPPGTPGLTVIPPGGEGSLANTVALGTIRVTDLTGSRTAAQWISYLSTPANWSYVAGASGLSGLPSSLSVVPEPAEWSWISAAGMAGVVAWRHRRLRKP